MEICTVTLKSRGIHLVLIYKSRHADELIKNQIKQKPNKQPKKPQLTNNKTPQNETKNKPQSEYWSSAGFKQA